MLNKNCQHNRTYVMYDNPENFAERRCHDCRALVKTYAYRFQLTGQIELKIEAFDELRDLLSDSERLWLDRYFDKGTEEQRLQFLKNTRRRLLDEYT